MYFCDARSVRADRLLSLLLLLQHRGRRSAKELADELEVSTRTVLRDIEALSTAGVPVYAERGRHGGFALLPGYPTDLTGLTHDEALALLVAGSRSDGAGMAPALASAMRKVVAGLPAAQRDSRRAETRAGSSSETAGGCRSRRRRRAAVGRAVATGSARRRGGRRGRSGGVDGLGATSATGDRRSGDSDQLRESSLAGGGSGRR